MAGYRCPGRAAASNAGRCRRARARRISEAGARRAGGAGAGYIGLEVAEGLLARGLDVTVVERLDAPMGAVLDADMAGAVTDAMRDAGADQAGTAVSGFTAKGGQVAMVETEAGADGLNWWSSGRATPHVDLACNAGIGVGESGGIIVDQMRTSAPNRLGRGRLRRVAPSRQRSGRLLPAKQAGLPGPTLRAARSALVAAVGTAITKFQHLEIARTGLTEREAQAAGFDAFGLINKPPSRAHYYPGRSRCASRSWPSR
ncbi:MAG: NAD-binding protein [Burkholderiaceae bacterium]